MINLIIFRVNDAMTRNVHWSRASVRACVRVCVCACVCVCLCVCLSVRRPNYCTDPDVTSGNCKACHLAVHCWTDLQSMHRFRCYGNIAPNSLYAWLPNLKCIVSPGPKIGREPQSLKVGHLSSTTIIWACLAHVRLS